MAQIIRAEHMGFCFGVRDAFTVATQLPDPQHTAIYGELVHNADVMDVLKKRDYQVIGESQRDALPDRPVVMVTAHGISDQRREKLQASGKEIVDTTCPLVRRVHQAALGLIERGYFVVLIGGRDHVEVQGIVEDLPPDRCVVIGTAAEVQPWGESKIGIISQTTVPDEVAQACRDAVAKQNPHASIRWVNTICRPTRQRQNAVDRLCQQVEVVVVVGGKNSNNTRRLVQRCESHGVAAHHVQTVDDLDAGWFAGHNRIGLTAGTSTPDATIEAVEVALHQLTDGEKTDDQQRNHELPGPCRTRHDQTWCSEWTNGQWADYFRDNMNDAPAIPWSDKPTLSSVERAAVIASIQTFQLGESGEGRHIRAVAGVWIDRGGDADYLVALKLFLQEENCHAAWLAQFLKQEKAPLLQKQWSNVWFRRIRQLAGLRTSVMVLLTAEILAQVYFLALMRATDSSPLKTICQRVLRDERSHVVFQQNQANQLAKTWGPTRRLLANLIETVGFRVARRIVWHDHHSVFVAAKMDWRTYRDRTQRRWSAARRMRRR